MYPYEYHQPLNLLDALQFMENSRGEAEYIAGGTDLLIRIKQGYLQPKALISLRGLEKLKSIEDNGAFTLGSMTKIRDLERSIRVKQAYPALYQACRSMANPQIRNVATIGGNLINAAPSADCATPLLVLDAQITLAGPGGNKEISIDKLFKGPGQTSKYHEEILTRISLPPRVTNSGSAFIKLGRVTQDIAKVNVAAFVAMENSTCRVCRLAAGAVAPSPLRLYKTEQIVQGQKITQELLEHITETIKEEISPISDIRSTEEYRKEVTATLIKRAILQAKKSSY